MVTVDSYILHPVTYSVVNIIMHWPSEVADCDKTQTHVKSCIKSCGYHGYFHAHKTFLHTQCSLCETELAYFFHMIQRKFNRSKSIVCVTWDGCGPEGVLCISSECGQKSKPKKINPMKPKKSLDQKSTHIPMLNIVKMVYWY